MRARRVWVAGCVVLVATTLAATLTGVSKGLAVNAQGSAWEAAICPAPGDAVARDDAPVTVLHPPGPALVVGHVDPAMWANPPVTDPAWRLRFYSLGWLLPPAKAAHDHGQAHAMDAILAQVTAFYAAHPDPGRPVLGWDEGTSLRRLETLNCLRLLTGDERLDPGIRAEVAVLLGPRYYGPPQRPVHNHGLMANLHLLRAGIVLDRADWVEVARTRMREEAALAVTPSGTSHEQSSAYHLMNAHLWEHAAARLAELYTVDLAELRVRQVTRTSAEVSRWLTEPDGGIVLIGDSERGPGHVGWSGARPGVFRDDEAGLVVGRWSWTDPTTTYYTIRYGPPRWAHGHHDKGAVTWSTAGVRVLVGPGFRGYDERDPLVARTRTMTAHNTAAVVGRAFDETAAATVRAEERSEGRHAWTVTDEVYGVQRARRVVVDDPANELTVTDTAPGTIRQSWHLDPGWRMASASSSRLEFSDVDGARLVMTTTGRVRDVVAGRMAPPAGWHHPARGEAEPSLEITVAGEPGLRTVFRVDRPGDPRS